MNHNMLLFHANPNSHVNNFLFYFQNVPQRSLLKEHKPTHLISFTYEETYLPFTNKTSRTRLNSLMKLQIFKSLA